VEAAARQGDPEGVAARLGRVVVLDIEGVVIPRWEATVARILRGARELGFAPGLAWDVVWTRDAFQVLELNGKPGLFLHQVHRPLLRDPRVREYCRRRGVPCRP
jgi:hypothetical protein